MSLYFLRNGFHIVNTFSLFLPGGGQQYDGHSAQTAVATELPDVRPEKLGEGSQRQRR